MNPYTLAVFVEFVEASDRVVASFRAVGQDKTGPVEWTVDADAMRRLVIANANAKRAIENEKLAADLRENSREPESL